jgi:hypothetical protein
MNSLLVAGLSLASALAGVVFGMLVCRIIPESHLQKDSKTGIQLATGLIATMAALVLGLLIGGAQASFESQRTGLQELATNIILLDRTLAHYGPEAKPARAQLRKTVATMVEHFRPPDHAERSGLADENITAEGGALFEAIRGLAPADDAHRGAKSHALEMNSDLARARWLLTQRNEDTIPTAFLIVLFFWFFVLFASLAAFWSQNATVTLVLFLCGVSVASAIFLIVDLNQPFEGLIQVSSQSLESALAELGK